VYLRTNGGVGSTAYVAEGTAGTSADWRAWISGPMPMTYAAMAALTASQYTNQTFFITDIGTNGSIWRCTGSTFVPMTRITSTWAGLPAAATYSGLEAFVSDVGVAGSLWRSNGTLWVPQSVITLYVNSAQSAGHTGTTAETAIASHTATIPAGVMRETGTLRYQLLSSYPNNANNKTPRVRMHTVSGVVGGTAYSSNTGTTSLSMQSEGLISNRSASSQVAAPSNIFGNGGVTVNSIPTSSINTANASYLNPTLQNADAGDTSYVERFIVELLP
jgi:hypothetical protein